MIRIAPVRKQLIVKASQSRAFAVFTAEMSRWWPATHSILKSPLKECIVEPRVGGRWYAVGEDGSSCETGYVIACNHLRFSCWRGRSTPSGSSTPNSSPRSK